MVSFRDIHHDGQLIAEEVNFDHYGSTTFYFKYDANYIQLKINPSLQEFQQAERYLEDYQKNHQQEHMKFYLPADEKIKEDVLVYLYQQFYTIGCQELYEINPLQFLYKDKKNGIVVEEVTNANFTEYLQLQRNFDQDYGEEYVNLNRRLHSYHYNAKDTLQLIAYDHGVPAGSLQVFINKCTAEIDSVGVLPTHRLKGIAAILQYEVMKRFNNHKVILVADSNDTPKDMYRKQGYKKVSFRYEVMKLL
ncbi:GNAT family N-acetyltransferase [Cytobacillus sp. FSL K6-0265]|uniref:GNAT family N-acetyltransferase n=1 Tax=Cytobacillus sp. FSL K6-0265 TaxID=2921448 RepID=UPI0030F83ADD